MKQRFLRGGRIQTDRLALEVDDQIIAQVRGTAPAGETLGTLRDELSEVTSEELPSDFDWQNIPSSFENKTWIISRDFDLESNDVTLPAGVTIRHERGVISNYGTITTDNTRIIETHRKVFDASGTITPPMHGRTNPEMFGALGGVFDDTIPIQKSIDASRDWKQYHPHRITATINIDKSMLAESAGVALKPDSSVLHAVYIGSDSTPFGIIAKNLLVDRTTYSGATENTGFRIGPCAGCHFSDLHSRYSKYNLLIDPTTSVSGYNTYVNFLGVGGFYNIHMKATGAAFASENTFFGGRLFATADTNTQIYIEPGVMSANNFYSICAEGTGVQSVYCGAASSLFDHVRTEGTWSSGYAIVFGVDSAFNVVRHSRSDCTILDESVTGAKPAGGLNQIYTMASGHSLQGNVDSVTTLKATRSGNHSGDIPAAIIRDISASSSNHALDIKTRLNQSNSTAIRVLRDSDDFEYASLTTDGRLSLFRSLDIGLHTYNYSPLTIGSYIFWVDSTGRLRIKSSTPTSQDDGDVFVLGSDLPSVDTTANRPGSPETGQQHFDTTLGQPIWYDGTNWIDSAGTTV